MSESGRVAFYARVSSETQARDRTIDSQIVALKARIAADGYQLEPDRGYVDDGCSGTTLQRPALEKLRDAVAGGEVERIYVQAPDRLARSYAHQVLLIEEFRRAGTEVVFLNRAIGDTAEDKLLLHVQGIIAEYERTKISRAGSAWPPTRRSLRRGQRVDGGPLRVSLHLPRPGRWNGALRGRGGRGRDRASHLCVGWPRSIELARSVSAAAANRLPKSARSAALECHGNPGHARQSGLYRASCARALARGAGWAAVALDPAECATGAERHAACGWTARRMDRDCGAGPSRSRTFRGGARAARREPQTQARQPAGSTLAAAGTDGLPLLRLCLLRQEVCSLANGSLEGQAPLLSLHRRRCIPAQWRDQMRQSNGAR